MNVFVQYPSLLKAYKFGIRNEKRIRFLMAELCSSISGILTSISSRGPDESSLSWEHESKIIALK